MNLLFIAPDLPYPLKNGGKIRTYCLIAELAKRHQVTLLAFDCEPDDKTRIPELSKICNNIISIPLNDAQSFKAKRKTQLLSLFTTHPYIYYAHFNKQFQQAIDAITQQERFDLVQVEFSQMGYYKYPENIPCILDEHNVEYDIMYRTYINTRVSFRKLYSYCEWKKYRHDEIENCRNFDLCFTTSIRDLKILSERLPANTFTVIPNGVDGNYFRANSNNITKKYTLVFTGTINYYPNTDGLIYFLEQIFPLIRQQIPDISFYIAGRDPPQEILRFQNTPGVIITGIVEDIRVYFDMASIVVVPLRIGGGTRLKILESWAMHKPIVSTSVGAEGLDYEHGKNILIADEPENFAKAVISLFNDDQLYKQLADEGRKLIDHYYDWSNIAVQTENAYEQLLQQYCHNKPRHSVPHSVEIISS